MIPRQAWRRRSATAVGLYVATAFGIAATIVAARMLGVVGFGLFATAMAAAGFSQALLDLTVEESLTKYGFRYVAQEEWGKLRRLFSRALELKLMGGALATIMLLVLATFADAIFGTAGLAAPLVAIAALPLVQAPENVASTALLLRGRYDARGWFQALAMSLRLTAIAIGAQYGVTAAMAGIVVAQTIATSAFCIGGLSAFRRFPVARPAALGDDRREVVSFVLQSSAASGLLAVRGPFVPLVLGMVSNVTQVGFLRVAQAPLTGFQTVSAPARLIMLTEQTRDWERGERPKIFRGVRMYMLAAAGLMAIVVPILFLLMPWLVRLVFGAGFAGAVDAARIALFAGAIQFVFGWSKSFPVSIGQPHKRILALGVETVVLLGLTVTLGAAYGVTGAAVAMLVSSAVFAALWSVLLLRLQAEWTGANRTTEHEALAP